MANAAQRPLPDDVRIDAIARPSGSRLQVLIRVPFPALSGIQFLTRPNTGFLDMSQFDTILPAAARYFVANSMKIYENGASVPRPEVLQTRAASSGDRSFLSWDQAFAHVYAPKLPDTENLTFNQTYLDALLEYPIQSDQSSFSIQPAFAHLGARVHTDLKFIPSDNVVRAFSFDGDPGLIKLEPQASDVAGQFFKWGFSQLTGGTDYLLFLFCLLLPFRTCLRSALLLGGAFALTHSATLIASALNQAPDGLWFPPLVETAIAVSIVYLALENIAGTVTLSWRVIASLILGLLYGFSFAFGLTAKAQYAGHYSLLSAIAFNAGVEAALLATIAVMLVILNLLLRFTTARRTEIIVLSVLSAHTAWHWMTERYDRLSRFPLRLPSFDAAFFAVTLRWMMILVILAGIAWFASTFFNKPKDSAV